MAKKIKTAMPPNLHLGGQWIVEWDAVDPTTGNTVAGVKISDTSLGVAGPESSLADIGNPLLIGAGVIVQAVAGIDWTIVIASAIPTVPATLAVLISNVNRRSLRTPSGDAIGHVVERTHDLAAVTAAGIGMTAQPSLANSAERLEADENSPLKVNGDPATVIHPKEET